MKRRIKISANLAFILLMTLVIGTIVYYLNNINKPKDDTVDLSYFAKCLTNKGWVMYGARGCFACTAQKKMFGKDFKWIRYVDCNPKAFGNEAQLCQKKAIHNTPTWLLEQNGKIVERVIGFKLENELSNISKCPLNEN